MGCIGDCCFKITTIIASLIKIGIAIAIIVIVAVELSNVTIDSNLNITEQCIMGNKGGTSLCVYAYIVCGVSLAASFVLSLFLCLTCDLCGLGGILEFALAVFGILWWVAAAVTFTAEGTDANSANLPKEGYRNAVFILCWINVGVFGFVSILYLIKGISKICKCCCGGSSDSKA